MTRIMFTAVLLGLASAGDWEDFKVNFKKTYHSQEQDAHRRGIFEKNLEFVHEENAKGLGYELGINEFADLLVEEWAAQHFGMAKPAKPYGATPYVGRHAVGNASLPTSVDWAAKGAVTPVKNQGSCGSCWAFSTTGSIEGANQIKNGKLVSLSEQQFVDCAGSFGNQGCSGGLMDNAFKYAEQNAVCTEDSYPYKGTAGSCQATSCTAGIAKGTVTGYKDVTPSSKEDLMSAVAQQPVSIAIEADKQVFQLYKSGVLSDLCGASLDHGVLAVGYGTDANGVDYWKVKNSWGATWGMNGYVLLKRGKGGSGECGLLKEPSYPQVSGSEAIVV